MPSIAIRKSWAVTVLAVLIMAAAVFQPAFVYAAPPTNTTAPPTNTTTPPTNTAQPPTGPPPAAKGEPSQASCGWDVYCHGIKIFNKVTLQIGYGIGYVAALFISLAVGIIQIIINAGGQITSSPLITTGFRISLDVANLGFVLAIIVIAYTTIFRISGYETKKLLKNLIIAALLVNFSFTIAGMIIDASNIFGNYFLASVSPKGIIEFGDNLANSLNVQALSGAEIGIGKGLVGSILDNTRGWLMAFASLAATAIFSGILVITFFAVAFMLLVRYLYITFLLIVMPIAWLMWIFPGYSKHWNEWWGKFIQWNLFYPAVAFFLYLSIFTSQELGKKMGEFGFDAKALKGADALTGLGTATLLGFIQIIVQVGIVLGGLMVANKLGITGADGALKMASGFKNWVIGATGKVAALPLIGARAAAKYYGTRPAKATATGVGRLLQTRALRWIPGAQTAAGNLQALGSRKEEVEEYQKKYLGNLTKDQFESMQKHPPLGPVAKAAILAESAKRGTIGNLTQKIPDTATPEEQANIEKRNEAVLKDYVSAAQSVNPGVALGDISTIKEITNVNPEFVTKLGITDKDGKAVTIADAVKKIRADKAADINKDSLKNPDVARALTQPQISDVYRRGSETQINTLRETLEKTAGPELKAIADDLVKLNEQLKNAKTFGTKSEIDAAKTAIKSRLMEQKFALSKATSEAKEASEKLWILNQRIGNPNV